MPEPPPRAAVLSLHLGRVPRALSPLRAGDQRDAGGIPGTKPAERPCSTRAGRDRAVAGDGHPLHPEQGSRSAVKAIGGFGGEGKEQTQWVQHWVGGAPSTLLSDPLRTTLHPQTPRNWNSSRGPLSRMVGAASPHKATPASPRAPGCCSLTPCAGRLEPANELGPFPASRSRVAPAGVGHRSPRDGRDSVVWIGGNGRHPVRGCKDFGFGWMGSSTHSGSSASSSSPSVSQISPICSAVMLAQSQLGHGTNLGTPRTPNGGTQPLSLLLLSLHLPPSSSSCLP